MDTKNIRSIVVATDLSHDADRVVRAAAAIASLTGARLHVLHVDVLPAGPGAEWSGQNRGHSARLEAAERELEAQTRRSTPSRFTPAEQVVVSGISASESIRTFAESVSADLIVLGPHRGPVSDRLFLGTTADRLARTAGVPCLIVRDSIDFPVRRIGVLTDFSPASQAALDTAYAWMEAFAGGRAAVKAGSPAIFIAHVAEPTAEANRRALTATKIQPALDQLIARAHERAARERSVELVPGVLWGESLADAVNAWADENDLAILVLGTQGTSRLPYLYLGGVASRVARSAKRAVLLVPPGFVAGAGEMPTSGTRRFRRVVTAVDFHESSREAARWAVRHFAPDAQHDFVHVLDLPEFPGPLRGLGFDREQLRRSAREGAEQRLSELVEPGQAVIRTHLRDGRPESEVVRAANELGADLIIVGEQGETRGIAALLGSTAERVLHNSPVPVLVARNLRDAPPAQLLVALDPSEVSGHILEWTAALVSRFGAHATILNVVDRVLLADELTGIPSARDLEALQGQAIERMGNWLREKVHAAGLVPASIETKVVVGDPGYEISAEAARAGADLVLLGSKGGDISRTPLIGRIINKVVRNAPCSVFVIPRARDPRGT